MNIKAPNGGTPSMSQLLRVVPRVDAEGNLSPSHQHTQTAQTIRRRANGFGGLAKELCRASIMGLLVRVVYAHSPST